MSKKQMTRLGWHKYYVHRFNKTQDPQAAHLACWYYLLHLEEKDEPVL
jgi:hypothetical protein